MNLRNFLLAGVVVFTASQATAGQLLFDSYTANLDDDRARAYLPLLGYLGNDYVAELYWAPGLTSNPGDLTYLGSADTLFFGTTGGNSETTGYFTHFSSIPLPGGVATLAIDVDRADGLGFFSNRGVYDGGIGNLATRGYFTLGGAELFQLNIPVEGASIIDLHGLTWTVPEPSSGSLLFLGIGLPALRRYFKRQPARAD